MRADNKSIGLLCVAYFAIQLCFIAYTILSVDDLWLSYHTYQFKSLLPYRDFSPYKTVLGYYILSLPLYFFHGVITPLLYTKAFIAVINTVFLAGTAIWLQKFFPTKAILISLALIIFTQFFINYSTEIRVDIIAYWFCLISVIFIFENKYFLAGICLGIGFAASQKALGYWVATNIAWLAYFLLTNRSWQAVRLVIAFNVAAGLSIAAYIAFWAHYSSLHTVLHNVFYEAYVVSEIDSYSSSRFVFWDFILRNNPLYCLLCPLAVLSLFVRPTQDSSYGLRIFITVYAMMILFSFISYKQPFAYNLTVTLPAFYLLYTAFFSWIFALFDNTRIKIISIGKAGAIGLIVLYLFSLLQLFCKYSLPPAYLLIGLIAVVIGYFLVSKKEAQTCLLLVLLITFFTGIIYPVFRTLDLLPDFNGRYQRYTFNLIQHLLADGSLYVAGEPLFYNKEQTIPGLKHLIVPELEYLYQPTKKLLPVMQLSSLYVTPITNQEIISNLQRTPIKLYVNNNRFYQLPPAIKKYLDTQYQHYWSSIYIYAPEVAAGKQEISINFAGHYKVNSKKAIVLDGKTIEPLTVIQLEKKKYASDSDVIYRLSLVPDDMRGWLDPKYKKDDWEDVLL